MPKDPRISIVTPSFNQAQFIERTIESVFNQQYPNLEYIIVDGASTDGSVDIIRKYEDRLAFWVSEPDRGQTHALNKGFMMATGSIVAWINSDDMYPEGTFRAIAEEFRRNPKLDIVYGHRCYVDANDDVIQIVKSAKVWYPMLLAIGNVVPQPAAFWKRNLFERVGYLNESLNFVMDREFMCRAVRSARLKNIKRVTCFFRKQLEQKTQLIHHVHIEENQFLQQRYGPLAYGKMPPLIMKMLCYLLRMFYLFVDGEYRYIFRRIARLPAKFLRLKSAPWR